MSYSLLQLQDKSFVRIDPEDLAKVAEYRWRRNRTGYTVRHTTIRVHGKPRTKLYLLHRIIMKAPKGTVVDHRNGDINDCRKSNLRITDHSHNRMNARKPRGCASPFKGVQLRTGRPHPWIARIENHKYLGAFEEEHTAALMHDFWAVELYGQFARTNFPVVAHL